MKFKNERTGTVLSEKEYNVFIEREARELWKDEYTRYVHDDDINHLIDELKRNDEDFSVIDD